MSREMAKPREEVSSNFSSKVLYGERQGYNENDYLQPVGGCDTDVGNACFRPSTKRLLREAAHD
jgi:hypothetical protein